LFGQRLRTSVSRLEKFATCPFAHFSAYGLKLQERPLYKLGAPDLGHFFHAALKGFVDYLDTEKLEWATLSPGDCREITRSVVDRLLPKLQNEILLSTNRYRYLSRKLRRTVERSALVLTEHARRGTFRPVGVEIGFGKGEKLPPLICDLGNGIIMELTGRIDRVDLARGEAGGYFRVIDYKSSIQKLSLEEIYYGLKLQLLTYLEVILENAEILGGHQAIPAGLLYFPVKDPLITSKLPLSSEKLEEEIFKKLKMRGYILEDTEVVKMMDDSIGSTSKLIPAAP
jgi:ATP-dependent helicase/nuclease subunit B